MFVKFAQTKKIDTHTHTHTIFVLFFYFIFVFFIFVFFCIDNTFRLPAIPDEYNTDNYLQIFDWKPHDIRKHQDATITDDSGVVKFLLRLKIEAKFIRNQENVASGFVHCFLFSNRSAFFFFFFCFCFILVF